MSEASNVLALIDRSSWQRASLGKLLPIKYGKSLPAQLRDASGSHPVYGSSGMVGTHSAALTSGPTLIVGRKGNVGAIHYSTVPCWPIDTAYFVEAPSGHNLRYYKYLLESLNLKRLDRSTAIPGLSRDDYNAVEVVIAPMEQQDEIVAEIEKQFSRLDEAVANLQRVKANLKRYKASVLKAAVEGRLVETEASLAHREGHTFETGEQLVQRILEERRAKWTGKGKFKTYKRPNESDLPSLPKGWIWSSFEAVADRVTVGHVGSMKNEYVDIGVPFLRSQNVRPNRFDPEGLKYISSEFHSSLGKSALRPGDIAVVRSGSVGVSCVIPDSLPDANCSDLVIIKAPRGVESRYGAYYLNSVVESRIAAGRVGVALVHFNTQSVAELPLPLPPMAEQLRIAAEVDRHLSIVREVEAEVDTNLKRAQALRQATLAKAFGVKH